MKTDTIAAIATGMSNSGIGIIRISGEDAFQIADKIFYGNGGKKKLSEVESHTVHYGHIVDLLDEKNSDTSETSNRNIVDEVMVSVFHSPRSYTTEDTVEINCHGGVLMVNRILELCLKAGARLATPGEFTKRAFLNGRIDLSKAEAVIDIIHSKNEFALKNSVHQLKGSVSNAVKKMREEIIYEIAFIESALDDPEHISLDGYLDTLSVKIDDLVGRIKTLIDSADNGKMMKEGINTVIVGKPNAGKSSLLNLLVGQDKAIVTDIAGTTRDVLEESIKLHGIGLNIIDTAGIRNTDDIVEKIGVEKARKYALEADLVIYVVDSSVPLDENDKEIIGIVKEENKKCIALLNKTDLESVVTEEMIVESFDGLDITIIKTSTKENSGIDVFEHAIKDMFFTGEIEMDTEVCITNMRHKEALIDAYESLKLVKGSILDEMPEDFLSIDLMSAYASLGAIIGEEVGEDLVNEIFSKFCMGK
ncbi:MAG: tRNA uridine-5-carboxymethylaminomethyl(34) synthesis GTPase MnmE [Lachnospiraceae bacterium]|nr:tRNA uridine-5-carboxymethylaminomethyl(34) synthesis GTPase MnmE [Lachnospiraceae bacterium]